jgi:glycosyltransferase involved in cell wall biosynthesis
MIITNDLKEILNLQSLKIRLQDMCEINVKINLSNSEVLRYLTKSKIYFCLSHFEGFGITILESLLSGCFVITTNVGEQKNYLLSERRLIIENKNNYKLDIEYICNNGPSKENFNKSKEFLFKKVQTYAKSLYKVVSEDT